MGQMQDKVAVITGGGRGIGRAIAEGYAREGAKVVCAARSAPQVEEAVKSIVDGGGAALPFVCDVTNYEDLESLYEYAAVQFGGIDVVVANAGVNAEHSTVEKGDIEVWEKVLNTNLVGAYYTAKAAIPYLRKSPAGKLIFMGSGSGHRGFPNVSAYACAKAGVRMLVRVLAQEVVEYGICVHEIVPGLVETDMFKEGLDTDAYEYLTKLEWLKQPEDVVPLAIFIATQPAFGPSAQTYSLTRREL
jgi:3-oxoacyl-[acyl-carrier protein] reductase